MTDHVRLTGLFMDAIDLDAAGQKKLVDDLADSTLPADRELAEELRSLLAADDSIVTALRTAGLKPDEVSLRRTTMPVQLVQIRGYSVHGILGKGGMGVVYAADQLKPVREVAIKVLHEMSDEALVRFAAEFRIMLQLDHPGIARVLASGEVKGQPYFVMERIHGTTFDGAKKLDLPTKLDLFAQVCDAVHYAHSQGVIHRDLKPANIMLRAGGGVAILDFGVARAAGSQRTQQGDFLGTLMFMSPEAATGRADQIDARTDVYGLGVILFELVRGAPPYDLKDMHTAQAVRVIVSQAPKQLGSESRDLDAIAAQALAKQKAHRQASAAELAAQIRAVIPSLIR